MPPPTSTTQMMNIVVIASLSLANSKNSSLSTIQSKSKVIDMATLNQAQNANVQQLNSLNLNTGSRRNFANYLSLGHVLEGTNVVWKSEFKYI